MPVSFQLPSLPSTLTNSLLSPKFFEDQQFMSGQLAKARAVEFLQRRGGDQCLQIVAANIKSFLNIRHRKFSSALEAHAVTWLVKKKSTFFFLMPPAGGCHTNVQPRWEVLDQRTPLIIVVISVAICVDPRDDRAACL